METTIQHSGSLAAPEEFLRDQGGFEVTMRDFVINCFPEDPTLDAMQIAVYGLLDKDNVRRQKINPTRRKYHPEIQLHSGMDEIILSVKREDPVIVGHVIFSKDELTAFLALDCDTKLERDLIVSKEDNPCLKLTFTLGVSQKTKIADGSLTQRSAVNLNLKRHSFEMALSASEMGNSFLKCFNSSGNLADLEYAILLQQRAIDLTPEGREDMSVWLGSLGVCLRTRFNKIGNPADLENAISLHQRAVDLTPKGRGDMPIWLDNLGVSLKTRFDSTDDLSALKRAISLQQKAIEIAPKGHIMIRVWLNNLGHSFQSSFDRTGDLSDVENAISTRKKAISLTPEGHADMPVGLNNLGYSLQAHVDRTGDFTNLEEAISIHQRAIDLFPEGHEEMPVCLNNLGIAFRMRFEHTGNLADLENAISTQQRAINFTAEGHERMPLWLSNLGLSFLSHFEDTDNISDLENAISTQKRAIDLTPEGHVQMPWRLNNFALSLQRRFSTTRKLEDLENAISILQRTVDVFPKGHANFPMSLNNLALSFRTRFELTDNLTDIESAISIHQKAVDLTPVGHAGMALMLNNLAIALQMRIHSTGKFADLENAICALQRAVDFTPEGHVNNCTLLANLAYLLLNRFISTHRTQHIHDAISMFRRCATQITGHPSTRLTVARDWARISWAHDKSQLLDAFSVAIQLLPQVAGLEQIIHKRHQTLINVSDITASATAAAIEYGDLDTALAWLEQGRCLVWSQINDLRTPTEGLHRYNPSLADRFLRVARNLEISGSRQEGNSTFLEGNIMEMISRQEEVHKHVKLANEWNEILKEIRCIPELQDFLRPPQTSRLLNHLPLDGPIVIFNIHKDRCDALALISGLDSPVHIPLENFSLERAIQLRDEMRQYLTSHGVRQRQEMDRGTFRLHPKGVDIYNVLHKLWEDVIKPVLDALAYSPRHSDHPRIWWCPTGPLAFLPIHAAGIYGKDGSPAGPCTADYVVSSYTLTITALLDKIKIPLTDVKSTKLLIISQPSTPGQSPIPGAEQESHVLQDMVSPSSTSLLLENASATVIRVKEEMKSYNWIHFACHAIQDAAEPLKSGMQLYDGRLEVLEMMKQTLPHADLAFLSACQTSTGHEKLADEVVHLAAGILAAGYRSVIATMWSIQDRYGPIISKDFYEHVLAANLGDEQLDSTHAARALHYATQKLRKELGDTEEALLTWVPYVHFGI